MALATNEVRVAGTGKVYIAPAGTTLPTDSQAALSATTWTDLGYVTEDGVTFNFNRETEDLNAWQGDKIRVLSLKEPKSVEFALMQTSAETLKAAFGGGSVVTKVTTAATGTAGTPGFKPAVVENVYTPPKKGSNDEHALVIEFNDGTIVYRYVFAKVAQQGEITFTLTRAGALTYPITFGVLDADPAYTILTNDAALGAVATTP